MSHTDFIKAVNTLVGDQPEKGPLPQHNPNVFDVGALKFEAIGDRLIILEDQFKSGYECPKCDGHGVYGCNSCNQGVKPNGKKCSDCEGKGHVTCTECGGKGGLLIAPETAQRRPTTGRIVSVGDRCKELKLGDSVLYSNFSGYIVDLVRAGQPIVLRILHETEVLTRMEGQFTLTNMKGKSEIATFQS